MLEYHHCTWCGMVPFETLQRGADILKQRILQGVVEFHYACQVCEWRSIDFFSFDPCSSIMVPFAVP